ncbi:MAG: hypothetical protein OK455_03745 [Thaumarchaeota archaeon]|nr:hypothetical protein [Nitrososphaerota archaeon]
MQTNRLPWNDVVKKEAKGLADYSLGEVQEVGTNFIVTLKGTISKHKYFIPKYLVRGFDGKTLWFDVTEQQAESEFKRDKAPAPDEYYKYRPSGSAEDSENWVPSVSPPNSPSTF